MSTAESNKAVIRRFNKEFIEEGRKDVFYELVAPDFIHHTMPKGMARGPKGLLYFFNEYLRPTFPYLKVRICVQIAEGDKVATYKVFYCRQNGGLTGLDNTGRRIKMEAVEISRLRDGKIVEQWNVMNLEGVMAQVREQANNIY